MTGFHKASHLHNAAGVPPTWTYSTDFFLDIVQTAADSTLVVGGHQTYMLTVLKKEMSFPTCLLSFFSLLFKENYDHQAPDIGQRLYEFL